LADRMDAYPGSMSGGEQRRVAVARALINAPPLLLADEPTSDLDEGTGSDITDLLRELQPAGSVRVVPVTPCLRLPQRAPRHHARAPPRPARRRVGGPQGLGGGGGAPPLETAPAGRGQAGDPRWRASRATAAGAYSSGREPVARRENLPARRGRDLRRHSRRR